MGCGTCWIMLRPPRNRRGVRARAGNAHRLDVGFEDLLARMNDPRLKLTLDVGHLHCQGDVPIAAAIHRWAERLVNIHLDDMRRASTST